MNTISCVIRSVAERSLGLVTDKTTKQEDLRSYNRAFKF